MLIITTLLLYLLGALTFTQVSKRIVLSLAPRSSRKDQKRAVYLMSALWPFLAAQIVLQTVFGR